MSWASKVSWCSGCKGSICFVEERTSTLGVYLEFVAEGKGDFVGFFLQWHALVSQAEIIRLAEAHNIVARRRNCNLEMAGVVRVGLLGDSARGLHRDLDAAYRDPIFIENSPAQFCGCRCSGRHQQHEQNGLDAEFLHRFDGPPVYHSIRRAGESVVGLRRSLPGTASSF